MGLLDGKSAIVTGSARGIGRATAEAFVSEGAKVLINDIDGDVADQAASEIDGETATFSGDLTEEGVPDKLVETALEAFGRVDILVNNAARAIGGVVDQIDEAGWNTVISTNLTSVWRFMKCVVPHMRRQGGGSIVNMSSVQSLRGFHGWAAYAAAKGGINALTQQAAVDLAPAKIRVNAIAPGTIMTPLNEKVFREAADPQELIGRWNAAHPLGRFGEAEEVAETVLFLASDRSSFITGEIIRVDGGLAIKGD